MQMLHQIFNWKLFITRVYIVSKLFRRKIYFNQFWLASKPKNSIESSENAIIFLYDTQIDFNERHCCVATTTIQWYFTDSISKNRNTETVLFDWINQPTWCNQRWIWFWLTSSFSSPPLTKTQFVNVCNIISYFFFIVWIENSIQFTIQFHFQRIVCQFSASIYKYCVSLGKFDGENIQNMEDIMCADNSLGEKILFEARLLSVMLLYGIFSITFSKFSHEFASIEMIQWHPYQ